MIPRITQPVLGLTFVLVVWQTYVQISGVAPSILPSPVRVFSLVIMEWGKRPTSFIETIDVNLPRPRLAGGHMEAACDLENRLLEILRKQVEPA